MKKIVFKIGQTANNYSALYEDPKGVVAVTGDSLEALKTEAFSALKFHFEGLDKQPSWFKKNWEISFAFETQDLLRYYNQIFTRAALSKLTGINEKQLGHYLQGVHKPRADKAKKIEAALHKLGKELQAVELV